MRIKVATNSPLPTFNCWFGINEKQEKQTVHHLRKKLTKDLDLKVEPSNIQLLMDGFNLLPQTIIQDLVRDGDLITLKTQQQEKKSSIKKRKISSIEENHDTLPKLKKSKKSTEKVKKSKDTADKPLKKKKKVEKESKQPKKTEIKKQPKKTEKQPETEKKSIPFEGSSKTKKRNMRRRLLRQMKANSTIEAPIEPVIATPVNNESLIENLSISNIEPLQLIKKNKNKKKNHLKQLDQRSHVHYAPEQVDEPILHAGQNENLYGRAFVTLTESEPNYKGRHNTSKYPSREYLVNQVPTLFYAKEALTVEEIESEPSAVVERVEETQAIAPLLPTPVEEKAPEKPINYEDFPEANFTSNIPSTGNILAIKTLELTASYTPEISDWKQVKLINYNDTASQITIEYLPGFGKATTKGGKFDIRKKKKNYDDWYNQQQEEEEEEEVEETQVTIECADVFAMRNMS